jgi:hypothetical protein
LELNLIAQKRLCGPMPPIALAPPEKEKAMATYTMSERTCRVGFFSSKEQAGQAVQDLLAAGFTKKELAVICPANRKKGVAFSVLRAEPPGSQGAEAPAEGGAIGAAIGGIVLAATAIATGRGGLLPAVPMLVGGGAIAGGFGSLILSDGCGKGVGEYYLDAIHRGNIVVGVEVEVEESDTLLAQAERILIDDGAVLPPP